MRCLPPGITIGRWPIASCTGFPRTGAQRSTCRPWSSATAVRTPGRGWCLRVTRRLGKNIYMGNFCRMPRAKTWSLVSAIRSISVRCVASCRTSMPIWLMSASALSATFVTCRTLSSPCRTARSICCRHVVPSARRQRPYAPRLK